MVKLSTDYNSTPLFFLSFFKKKKNFLHDNSFKNQNEKTLKVSFSYFQVKNKIK